VIGPDGVWLSGLSVDAKEVLLLRPFGGWWVAFGHMRPLLVSAVLHGLRSLHEVVDA
jgi:hypothetical protein